VAEGDEQEKGDRKKGFAGLSSMVSDVDSTVAQPARETKPASRAASAPAPAERARSTDDQEPNRPVYQAPAQSSGGSSTGRWLLGIGVVAGLLWLVSQSGDKTSSPAPAFTPSSDSSSVASPSPSWQPAQSPTAAPSRPSEERPPAGTNNVLTSAQLRYCVAEKIRLDAAEGAINNYNQAHVDRFNEMVADYNGRCGQFRYRSGALESARAEVERFRGALEADGRARFVRGKAASQDWTVVSEEPISDPTVGAIQRRLNEIGYDAGPPDGVMGTRTKAAIGSFQADQGLPVDGIPSASILDRAKSASMRPQRDAQSAPADRTSGSARRSLSDLTAEERGSIESACYLPKQTEGPAAYNACLSAKLGALARQGRRPDLSSLSAVERGSIESACYLPKQTEGPAAYHACLTDGLSALARQGRRPDLSRLSAVERESIESACYLPKQTEGPAAYHACLSAKLDALAGQGRRPDLSRLSAVERQSIESACYLPKQTEGPAAYNACVSQQLATLRPR